MDTRIPLEVMPDTTVTAGSYGPSEDASPSHGASFEVPYLTVDAKGRVTQAFTKTITLPASGNTDTKVNVTLGKTTKAYILGTSTTPTATANAVESVADTGVYLSETSGELVATTFKGNLDGIAAKATADASGNNIANTYATKTENSGKAAADHIHGNITNDGKLSNTSSGSPLITGTDGIIQEGVFGNTAGTFTQGNDPRLSDARTPVSHAASTTTYGAASSTMYGHAMASSETPIVAGTAAVGTDNGKFAREGHIHPAQTSVSGNAGTATKLKTARTIDGVDFDGSAAISHYGMCSTAAGTAEKTVSVTSYKLVTGSWVAVKFTETNTASNPTLNVNSTGAKAIYYRGSAISAGSLAANRTYLFVYNGTQYELIGDLDTNTNTDTKVNVTLGTTAKAYILGTTTTPTSSAQGVTAISDTGVYLDTTAGRLTAGSFAGDGQNIVLNNASSLVVTDSNKKLTTASTLPTSAIPNIDASKITSGTIDIDRLPAGALERLVVCEDLTEIYALTTNDVQVGDTVKDQDTGRMYYVKDVDHLDSAEGYEEYSVGSAASVPWSGVTNKPASYTPAAHASSATTYGISTDTLYGHAMATTTTPKAPAGTAVLGSETAKFARGDHVHPLQTTISGNAGTATKFASAQTVKLQGDVGGEASSQAGWTIDTTLSNSGVTAGSYGPSANATPSYGATFNVPYITVDAKGRITAASTKTVKIPASDQVDIKVTQTSSTDNVELPLLAKASNATATITDTSKFAAAVTINPSTGTLTATKFSGEVSGNADSATTAKGVYLVIPNETAQAATLTATVSGITEYFPGLTIAYRAPFNTAASSTLNINNLGAKPIYYKVNTTSKDYYPANAVILLVYEVTTVSTGCWKMVYSYDGNNNNYDRRLHNNAVKAAAAITASTVIVGTSAGYKQAASGVTFDIQYPILYASAAIAANATATNTYEAMPSVNLQTTKESWAGTQYATVYLVGTISGTTVTIDSGIFTTAVPSTADGKVYIPIGVLYSTYQVYFAPTKDVYHYTNGSFHLYDHTTVSSGTETLAWNSSVTLATVNGTAIKAKLPQNPDTDSKVAVTLGTTTKAYLLGTSTTPTSSAQGVTAISDTGVYLDTTAGRLTASSFAGNGQNITLNAANAVVTTDSNKKLTTTSTLSASAIPNIDASKITSGTIDIARLPAGALERCVVVESEAARYALTTDDIQKGDTVKQKNSDNTYTMYFVVDDTKLDQAAGYEVYTAGSATSVPWSGVTSKPTTLSGYGINDAKIASGTITLGSSTITPLTSGSSLDASKLTGTASVNTTGKATTAGTADKVANNLVLKLKSGTTEGTDLYTYNGSGGKTLDIKQGSNITLTAASGSLTIAGVGDTKNTAGSTDSSSKLFLIGATSQAANPQTYSHDTAYVGTDGCLYSGGAKVLTAHQTLPTLSYSETGSGNAITSLSVSNHAITATKGTTFLTSHQSLSNYVTLNTAQTISAVKTFTAKPVLNQVGLDMTVKDTTEGSTTTRTSQVLHANSSNTQYGINIAFCSGGNAVVGGGEAGTAQLNALAGDNGEDLYLVADGNIYLKPNGNTWANAKTITLNNAAELSGLAKVTSTSFVGPLSGTPSGTSFVAAVTEGKALVNATTTGYGAIWNAPTKNYRVGCSTYPSSSDDVRIVYSVTNDNVTAGTNTVAKSLTWNADTGKLTATEFSGPLTGNVTGNCSGSSGSCTGNSATATTLKTARYIDGVSFDGSADIVHYGTCSTAAGTAAKTVSCTGYALKTGGRILVKFTNTNTAASATLNVNSTGAKAIYVNGAAIAVNVLQGGVIYEFVYNGTQYDLVNGKASVKYSTSAISAVPSDLAEGGIIIADA